MSKNNQTSFLRTLVISLTALSFAAVLLLPLATEITQGRTSAKPDRSARLSHIARLRVSDSSARGSRVTLTADQPLNSFDAHRRGDRLYVKIPRADVPRPDAVRGRGFKEVKVDVGAANTMVSFLLESNTTTNVEQKQNKLEIVFTISRPAAASAALAGRAAGKRTVNPAPPVAKKAAGTNSATSKIATEKQINQRSAKALSAATAATSTAPRNASTDEKAAQKQAPVPLSKGSVATQKKVSPENSAASVNTAPSQMGSGVTQTLASWRNFSQRNPVPVGLGVAGVFLLISFSLLRARRARAARKDQSAKTELTVCSSTIEGTSETVEDREGIRPAIEKPALEVGHRAEVMNSPRPADLKTIEASLVEAITNPSVNQDERRKALQALEEYGFVARHNKTLITDRDASQRAAAAQILGQIGSKTSLPFLLEALKDNNSQVRNQAVTSLASLKDPAAIGALLSIGQMQPDVPASLLSEALSACSVESLAFLDAPAPNAELLDEDKPSVESRDLTWFEEQSGEDEDLLAELLAELDGPSESVASESVLTSHPVLTPTIERPYLTLVA